MLFRTDDLINNTVFGIPMELLEKGLKEKLDTENAKNIQTVEKK